MTHLYWPRLLPGQIITTKDGYGNGYGYGDGHGYGHGYGGTDF